MESEQSNVESLKKKKKNEKKYVIIAADFSMGKCDGLDAKAIRKFS